MKNPLTYLNSLFDTFAEQTLSGHDQLIMLHIFNKFNRSHWQETVRISDRELQELCRLYDSTGKPVTIDTIRTAKSRLKLKGLINFKAGKGSSKTEYRIVNPTETPPHSPQETPADTPPDTEQNSYIRVREDVKDFKTLDSSISYLSNACANSQELDNLIDYWEQTLKGGRLSIEHQSEIQAWLEKYGVVWVKETMKEASDANGNSKGLNIKLLRGVVNRKLNPVSSRVLKGGEKVESDARAKWAYSD